ncbi:DDE Tnp4 domain-containing protein [Trichonephila clavipes]|nr:DDE Tnp4 domain-containing protein [Trichonephila clavipes]
MLAVVDADCKFTAVDVGSYGREGDAGIYLKSEIGQRIKNNTFNIPPPKALPGTDTVIPHVIVGDEAFALHQNLMKPYQGNSHCMMLQKQFIIIGCLELDGQPKMLLEYYAVISGFFFVQFQLLQKQQKKL